MLAIAFACAAAAQAQDTRFTNNQYGISFQPPAGWKADPLAQYFGPQRADKSAPSLALLSEETALDISDNRIETLARELREGISREGLEDVQIADRRKRTISGREALQLDIAYKVNDASLRQRRIYIPVREQNRTYMFMLVDTAQQFEQSAAAAEAAINSFALAGQPVQGANSASNDPARRSVPVLLLALLGIAALALIVGSAYLLLRQRASAH